MIATTEQTERQGSPPRACLQRAFDGVICLGGVDWWYHNRGHYDIQMMREFSAHVPVLYVNSIGMRVPQIGEGRVFVRRVARKLKSLRHVLVRVRENFHVFSPVAVPGSLGAAFTRRFLPMQIRRAARRAGIVNPLLWVACPPGAEIIDRVPHSCLVYQRTDRYEAFRGVDPVRIAGYDRTLKERADLTVFCSRSLHDDESGDCQSAAYVDHGVDFGRFEVAGDGGVPEPRDLADIPRPRIGFVGGIDAHTFDPDLLVTIARQCPDLQFVLVGGCSLPAGWCPLMNVSILGRRDYTEVAAYMAACDVLIMPWNASEWIKACNPVKLKEYLAVGRPIVSTPFNELAAYEGLVRVAENAESFVRAIRESLATPHDRLPGRDRVRAETWSAKADRTVAMLARQGTEMLAVRAPGHDPMTSVATTPTATAPGRSHARAAMVHLTTTAILVGAAVAATWSVWAGIFRYAYQNEEQGHSFLALPLAAWLVWVRRGKLKDLQTQWAVEGPAVMGAGWLLACEGFRSGVDVALHLGALMVVVGAAYTALGRQVFLRMLPAVGALDLVLPVPGRMRTAVAGPLQEWSAQITQFALDLFGVPVLRSGNMLTVNGVDVAIAEACNGMRMVSALGVIAYAFVFSGSLRPAVRIGILAMSPLLALAVNVLRLIPTALLYGYAKHETAELFHDVSGWGVLALAIGMLIGIVALLRWLEVPVDHSAKAGQPVKRTDDRTAGMQSRLVGWAAPTAALLVLGSVFVLGGFDARREPGMETYHARVRAAVADIPYRIGNAVGIDQAVSPGASRILHPNAMLERRYTDPSTGEGFGLMVIHCGDARDLLDHYPPVCYPAHGWTTCATQSRVFGAGPTAVAARMYDFKRRTETGETRTRVVSFFVLPKAEGSIVDDMESVAAASRSTVATALGAEHIMVSFSGDVGDTKVADIMGPVLELLEPTIRTTARGTIRD